MALFKYIVLSVCLCGIHLNGFAQSTREAILEDIARTGGVNYAYPVKEAIATPPPKGYKPFYISHYARHGSRWIQSEQDYKTVVDIFEKAHQAGASFWRGLNSLPGIPRTAWRRFAGTLRSPQIEMRFAHGWRQRVRETGLHCKKNNTTTMSWCYFLERATRLELATSTLARWRSTR